jgi:hypothetical protein
MCNQLCYAGCVHTSFHQLTTSVGADNDPQMKQRRRSWIRRHLHLPKSVLNLLPTCRRQADTIYSAISPMQRPEPRARAVLAPHEVIRAMAVNGNDPDLLPLRNRVASLGEQTARALYYKQPSSRPSSNISPAASSSPAKHVVPFELTPARRASLQVTHDLRAAAQQSKLKMFRHMEIDDVSDDEDDGMLIVCCA